MYIYEPGMYHIYISQWKQFFWDWLPKKNPTWNPNSRLLDAEKLRGVNSNHPFCFGISTPVLRPLKPPKKLKIFSMPTFFSEESPTFLKLVADRIEHKVLWKPWPSLPVWLDRWATKPAVVMVVGGNQRIWKTTVMINKMSVEESFVDPKQIRFVKEDVEV